LDDLVAIERFTGLYDRYRYRVYAYAVSRAGRQLPAGRRGGQRGVLPPSRRGPDGSSDDPRDSKAQAEQVRSVSRAPRSAQPMSGCDSNADSEVGCQRPPRDWLTVVQLPGGEAWQPRRPHDPGRRVRDVQALGGPPAPESITRGWTIIAGRGAPALPRPGYRNHRRDPR
jgi:hypothetical protein